MSNVVVNGNSTPNELNISFNCGAMKVGTKLATVAMNKMMTNG